MKMSEFTTKSFLGNAGAAENSYILINYEDNSTSRPVTYKASLQEIGKAIANDQKLYKKTQDGVITTATNQGTYADITEGLLVTSSEKTKISEAVTRGQLLDSYGLFASLRAGLASTGDLSGLASTGYVTSAITTATSGLASTGDLAAKASTGAVTAAVSGLASTGYVTAAVANAGSAAGFTNPGDIPVYVAGSEGQLRWYNWENPSDCTPYSVIKTNNAYILAYDATNDQIGYFADISDATLTSIAIGGDNNENNLYGYIQAAASLAGQYRLQFQEEGENGPTEVTPEMIGAASTGDITTAISGLASTGYVTTAVANAGGGFDPTAAVTCEVYPDPDDSDPQSWSLYPVMVAPSTDEIFTYDRGEKGYFPRAFVYYTTDTSNNIWLQDKGGNSLIVFRYNSTNDTYTPEVPHN